MRQYKLTINRSLKHISGQVIDLDGKVKATATSKNKKFNQKTKSQIAFEIGKELAEKLKTQKISSLWFDRKGQKYHGRIARLIESMRKQGIKI